MCSLILNLLNELNKIILCEPYLFFIINVILCKKNDSFRNIIVMSCKTPVTLGRRSHGVQKIFRTPR
jgi:hypothetical protein